ncbi:shikimate kinase [Xanthomonas theicola]|uniref:Shikimate kinase n=1 Tax=Xanthomonas theicola TaxID=56464 RepID=A0A2S6ZLF1_9XANT|nr:shikimate kinase [Xanthomonas theicola]PPT93101.1 shikimate kinase [Xanthomonas theicola]QNH24051.1 shikimate kinase [Xanthomonas theicola]
MNPAANLVLVGPMGAGKSVIGRRLAERFGLVFVDSDQAIVERTGASIASLFEHSGEAGFREHERAVLESVLVTPGHLISTGGGAVLDADSRREMRDHGFVVYLRISVASQLQRLHRDRSRPLLQRGDRERGLHDLQAVREPLYREVADLILDTDHLNPAEATAQLVVRLAAAWKLPEPTA